MTNKSRLGFTAIIPGALLMLIGCQPEVSENSVSDINPVTLSEPELLIDYEQGNLAQPLYIDLINEKLTILDTNLNQVLVYSTDGELMNEFGRKGKGPGEFDRPLYFNATNRYINVIDRSLYRINQFNYNGEFIGSFEFKGNARSNTVIAQDEGLYYTASLGRNQSLLRLSDPSEDSSHYFGQAMGEEYVPGDLEPERQALASGEIPQMYKNDVKIYTYEKHLFVFLEAYSRLQKYTHDGYLLWDTPIDLDLNKAMFQRLVERAKNGPVAAVPVLRYITSMKVVNGDTWLFWMPFEGSPRLLVKVDGDGTVEAIYHVPEEEPMFNDFTIDPGTNTLYLTAIQMGQVYSVQIPE